MIIRGPFNTLLGYGNCAANISYGISQLDPNLFISIIGNNPFLTDPNLVDCIKLGANFEKFNKNDPCLSIWHEFNLIENHIGRGKYFALPFFEINQLDPFRLHHLQYPDLVIATSTWMQQVLKNYNINSTVVNMGVNTNIFKPDININKNNEIYKFFNLGKIEVRKGHDILHEAFDVAFPYQSDVELHIFWESPVISKEENQDWIGKYKSILGERVYFHPTVPTDQQFADQIRWLDCGVFPTRAEGFGMPILQSLACGKPIITTDYSAITDFCNKNNAYIIPVTEFESAYDGKYFHGQGTWAKINFDILVDHMRYCYKNRITINEEGVKTAQKLTWENTCNKIWKLINE